MVVVLCGRSTVVVRLLAKEKVVGSNPIARSNIEGCGLEEYVRSAILIEYMASWPSGKARVCKILIAGSNLADASSKANQNRFAFLFKYYHEKTLKKVYNQLRERIP
jgi:hypothetical protein